MIKCFLTSRFFLTFNMIFKLEYQIEFIYSRVACSNDRRVVGFVTCVQLSFGTHSKLNAKCLVIIIGFIII